MRDCIFKLNDTLTVHGRELPEHAGSISHKVAESIVA
jgi:hypothetical protein